MGKLGDRSRFKGMTGGLILSGFILALICAERVVGAQTLARFDFTVASVVQQWQPAHDVARMEPVREGMRIVINGDDPYLIGPARDYPANQTLWLHIRLKSQQGGMGQVYYFTQAATEADSVRFPVRAGRWEDLRVPLPSLGPGTHLRLDPPGTGGVCLVSDLTLSPRVLLPTPEWPRPDPPQLERDTLSITSGSLKVVQAHHQLGGFTVYVDGQPMANGNTKPTIGYLLNGRPRYASAGEGSIATASMDQNILYVHAILRDHDGATWEIRQSFAPAKLGAIDVTASVSVDQPRSVICVPMLILLPGAGTFGHAKQQALFAGLEYLDRDEPSSSEADIHGPGALRQTPDSAKITFPLMALRQNDRYLALTWQQEKQFTALFDSPDRTFHAGGHLMGLLYPGADGNNRAPGSLLPYEGEPLAANQPIMLHATLMGGPAANITAAVQQYVALRGLPAGPNPGMDWQGYIALAARGWLDSGIAANGRFRHAYPNFPAQPAADAALMLEYLGTQTKNKALATRLMEAARTAATAVSPADLNASGIAHVRTPAPALVFSRNPSDVQANAARADETARGLDSRFEQDNSLHYHKSPDGLDYGKTHFAPDADGLTAQVVASQLEAATFSGDPQQIAAALHRLHGLDKFRNTAPRGAQTWEVPLHTPDILASAYLTRAYTLGYELTGDPGLLQQALEWAWSGVPFIYLTNPMDLPIGPYSTIAVYGATQWVAPNWMGLPVQWCGLVYADAIYRLRAYDPQGPWDRLADGITAAGIQQTWPCKSDPERQGLLPDSFDPKTQTRNDAAINPGTLLIDTIRYYERIPLYDFHACLLAGALIHAPGEISQVKERAGHVQFRVEGWPRAPYSLLISGLKTVPKVRVNGQEVALQSPNQYSEHEGRLVLQVQGSPLVRIDL